jgi:signal transduction histidine kinase
VDAERLRIARDLHDVLAHGISTINVQAGVAAHLIDRHPAQAGEALETIRRLSKEALGELREILELLRAVDAGDPRQPAARLTQLDALIESSTRAGVGVRLDCVGEPRPLPVTVDLAAYRIIQESLTNVLKHAGDATASVRLCYREHDVVVEVTDDGDGRTRDADADSGGFGLIGMRERAESLGGSFHADGQRDGGFRVCATLPVAGDGS